MGFGFGVWGLGIGVLRALESAAWILGSFKGFFLQVELGTPNFGRPFILTDSDLLQPAHCTGMCPRL